MSAVTEPLRREHEHLLVHVTHIRDAAREIPDLDPAERKAIVERVVGFLRHDLLPHADAEERILYPELARLVGGRDPLRAMIDDHATIAALTTRLGAAEPDDPLLLQELLFGLHALVLAHFRKEEEIYLPLLEIEPERAHELLHAVGHAPPAPVH